MTAGEPLDSGSSEGPPPERADVAQLVEHHLAKVGVAGSNPVVRSKKPPRSDAVFVSSFAVGALSSWRSGRTRLLEDRVEPLAEALRERGIEVSVPIQGQADARVPEVFLDGLWMMPLGDEERDAGVSEVVE